MIYNKLGKLRVKPQPAQSAGSIPLNYPPITTGSTYLPSYFDISSVR